MKSRTEEIRNNTTIAMKKNQHSVFEYKQKKIPRKQINLRILLKQQNHKR